MATRAIPTSCSVKGPITCLTISEKSRKCFKDTAYRRSRAPSSSPTSEPVYKVQNWLKRLVTGLELTDQPMMTSAARPWLYMKDKKDSWRSLISNGRLVWPTGPQLAAMRPRLGALESKRRNKERSKCELAVDLISPL